MSRNKLGDLKPEYERLFNTCQILPEWRDRVRETCQFIADKRPIYREIEAATQVPWWFVGILHYRESSFQEAHLHNGDPLTGKTVRVPKGRPKDPPSNGKRYSFVESAIDALRFKKYQGVRDRTLWAWMWRLELWNGFGYRDKGLRSEYLWNGTNHGQPGKFVADGKFDPTSTSEQCGAIALLKFFVDRQYVQLEENESTNIMESVYALFLSGHFDRDPGLDEFRLSLMQLTKNPAEGKTIEVWTCTSSTANKQKREDFHQKGGPIPPMYRVVGKGCYTVQTTPIPMPGVKGVEGSFYKIDPHLVTTDKGGVRGDFGIHKDANTPGSLGCPVMRADRFVSFEAQMKKLAGMGIKSVALVVQYS